jgi:hypothetical protein
MVVLYRLKVASLGLRMSIVGQNRKSLPSKRILLRGQPLRLRSL